MAQPAYAFGDTDLAAERLRVLAQAFDAPSRAFLRACAPARPRLAVDLGCGPGHTTRLVSDTTGASRTVGLDASGDFLARAAAGAVEGVSFAVHDVTEVPLPVAPADLIYCRLLLAHLPDPVGSVAAWGTQLREGGRLLADEVEWIRCEHPVLARYEELVTGVVAARGAVLNAGPVLGAAADPSGLSRCSDTVVVHRVPASMAARMFAMNLAVWRHDPAAARYGPATLDLLAAGLDRLARTPGSGSVTWGLRQIAWERAA